MFNDVKEYGPYIVIVPGVAMPHSSAKNEGVLGTGIGFTLLPEAVSFEAGNPEKDAQLFFMLAAKDSAAHMENIANLSDLLMTEGLKQITDQNDKTDQKSGLSQNVLSKVIPNTHQDI